MKTLILRLAMACAVLVMALQADISRAASPLDPEALPPSELRLTLKGAMEAALDNNPDVRLFKEKIVAARAASSTH